MGYNKSSPAPLPQILTQHSSEELTITCAIQDRVEWGDGRLTLGGQGCVRKAKKMVLLFSKKDEGLVCPLEKPLDCKQGRYYLESSCQIWIFYHLQKILQYSNFMNHKNPKFM